VKIREIRTYPVKVGTIPAEGDRPEFVHQLIVKVETDAGIGGLGESGLSGRESAVIAIIRQVEPMLVGRDPFDTGPIWQELYRHTYFEGSRDLTAAISAIDIALHDIKGKALGVPVWQLLGGRHRDHVPLFPTTEAPMGPELLDAGRRLVDAGWSIVRTWIHAPGEATGGRDFEPRASIGETAHWLARLREELGPNVMIGVDYHHRLSVAEAASFCQRMPSGTLDFLEEPIRDETPEAYEALRRLTDVPFAIGEEFASKWQFLPYIERGIAQYARVDVGNVGGLTEAMKVAAMCEAHYIDLMPHNPLGAIVTAATTHLAAAVPNFAAMEIRSSPTEDYGFYDPVLFPVQMAQDGPRMRIPTAPGLGVELDEDEARRRAAEFRPIPTRHLRRSDGSITNW
jgi:galactonate dehydratase